MKEFSESNYETGYTLNGWTLIKDRLPENSQNILFLTDKGVMRKGFFMLIDPFKRENIFYGEMGYFSLREVIIWMPLPELPKPTISLNKEVQAKVYLEKAVTEIIEITNPDKEWESTIKDFISKRFKKYAAIINQAKVM